MKYLAIPRILGALLIAAASLGSGNAFADRGHSHFGVHYGIYVGAPWGWPYYPRAYYPPLYYPPQQIIVQSPPVYIEQGAPQPAPVALPVSVPAAPPVAAANAPAAAGAANAYWYYCSRPQGYYPYVKECKVNWQPVSPLPPENPR